MCRDGRNAEAASFGTAARDGAEAGAASRGRDCEGQFARAKPAKPSLDVQHPVLYIDSATGGTNPLAGREMKEGRNDEPGDKIRKQS